MKKSKMNNFLKIMTIFLLLFILSWGCQDYQGSGTPSFPRQTDPFQGTFEGSEVVEINREARIVFQVRPSEDRGTAEIKLSLPFGLELTRGSLNWQGPLAKGQAVSLEAFVRTSRQMQGNIKAEVSSPGKSPDVVESRSYYYNVSTMSEGGPSSEAIKVE